jgi:cytosine/uracil/thiamine/allantoin permease
MFYWCYRWSEKVNSIHEPHHVNASVMLSTLIGINLLFAFGLFATFNEHGLDVLRSFPKIAAFVIAIGFCLLNYWFVSHNYRYKEIVREFSKRDRQNRDWAVGYVVISCALFIGLFGSWMFLID